MKKSKKKYPGYIQIHKEKKMRYLYFDVESGLKNPQETYENLYVGINDSQRGFDRKESRIIGKVQDKLEVIGRSDESNGRKVLSLPENSGDVENVPFVALEDAEYSLLVSTLEAIKWTGRYARFADELFTWLEIAPSKERERQKEAENSDGKAN